MKCINWKYMARMVVGFTAYALGLVALNYFYTEQSPHRYWLVLLPVVPILYVAITIIRYVSELDEMWRKVVTEAMAFSGVATGFTCFSYLFLRDMGAREFHGEWAFYIAWVYYGIGAIFSWRRYR
jgi:glucan phosphoethanolaminetransferase (alkaline phosphatase superfamily)